ncbi:MAG: GerAB/ArcD/ProY family transporter [Bacillota bacterium]
MSKTKENATINNNQFWTLLVCLISPTVIGYGAGIMSRLAGHDMWLSGLIALLTTMLFSLIVVYMGRLFPGKTIVDYSQELLGSIPGKALGFLLALYFLLVAVESVAIYVHHINDFLLPETPFLVITVIHVLVVCYLAWHGPEVIFRTSVFAFYLLMLFCSFVIIATIPEIDLDRVLPLFDTNLNAISSASLIANTFVGQSVMVIAMVLPMLKDQKKAVRSTVTGLSIGGIVFILYFLSELMIMGPHLTAQMRVACMDLVRSIQITEYLHRFESFMVALWYWNILVQAGILIYCATLALRQAVGIKQRNPWIVIASGVFLVVVTYYTAFNRMVFTNLLEYTWGYISLPIQFGLPLILLLMFYIRKMIKSIS